MNDLAIAKIITRYKRLRHDAPAEHIDTLAATLGLCDELIFPDLNRIAEVKTDRGFIAAMTMLAGAAEAILCEPETVH